MDYRDSKSYGSQKEADADTQQSLGSSASWWAADSDDTRAKQFIDHCRMVAANSQDREMANIRYARLFENAELNSLTSADFAISVVRQAVLNTGLVTLNVVAACIDTLAAKISKNKPRPFFLTSGGSWKSQIKARRLDRFMRGVFYETDVYEKAKPVFVDGEVTGTGFLHWYVNEDDNRLECERVLPSEIFIDDADGLHGSPRQLKRRKLVHKEVLAAMFPEAREAIMFGPNPSDAQAPLARPAMIEVWEGWHLPSSKKAKDGKHIIAIEGAELCCEEWKVQQFPFTVYKGKTRTVGTWGKGTAEALVGIQLELNRLIRSISEQLRRKGRNRLYLQMGSKVNPSHITNNIGDIVFYTGQPPVMDNGNVVSQEDYAQIDRLYQRAFQEVGVSELSAAAKKPSGLDAGVALREYQDIESERFALKHQAWDTFFMDASKLVVELITKQYKGLQNGYKVRSPNRRDTNEIEWKDVDLDADSFVMQIFPTSSLPQTPAARKQFVTELRAQNYVTDAEAKRLLEFPDVDAELDLGNAAIDDADYTISQILDEDEPRLLAPEPFQDLELLVKRAQANYLFARKFPDIEPERLDMLQALMTMGANAIAEALQPPPQPGMPMPGAPGLPAGPGGPPGLPANVNTTINAAPAPATAVPPLISG